MACADYAIPFGIRYAQRNMPVLRTEVPSKPTDFTYQVHPTEATVGST